MAKLQLTYVVRWTGPHGHEAETEVTVRAHSNTEGRQLADEVAERVIGAEGRKVPGNARIFYVEDVPRRIEA